jgi:hypothetical protein
MAANAQNSIEDKRQAKRDALAASLQKSQQDFLAGQGEANRLSQKELTMAQLAVSERLGKLQAETTKAVTSAEIGSRKELSDDQIKARMKELEKSTDSAERIAKMEVDSRKDIQALQAEAAQQLGIKEVTDAKGNVILMRPDGTRVEGPKDANGNEISLAPADGDTNEMKNIKYLVTTGVDPAKAQDMVLGPKNADPKLERLALFRAMVGTTLVPPTEDELRIKWDLAGTFQAKMDADAAAAAAGTPAPSVAAPGVTAPAADAGATTAPAQAPAATAVDNAAAPAAAAQPQQLTSEQRAQAIKDAKTAIKPKSEGGLGISPVKVIQELQEKYGISRVEAGL